jgi:hypothetical protein
MQAWTHVCRLLGIPTVGTRLGLTAAGIGGARHVDGVPPTRHVHGSQTLAEHEDSVLALLGGPHR